MKDLGNEMRLDGLRKDAARAWAKADMLKAALEDATDEIERLKAEIEKLNSIIMEYGDHFAEQLEK